MNSASRRSSLVRLLELRKATGASGHRSVLLPGMLRETCSLAKLLGSVGGAGAIRMFLGAGTRGNGLLMSMASSNTPASAGLGISNESLCDEVEGAVFLSRAFANAIASTEVAELRFEYTDASSRSRELAVDDDVRSLFGLSGPVKLELRSCSAVQGAAGSGGGVAWIEEESSGETSLTGNSSTIICGVAAPNLLTILAGATDTIGRLDCGWTLVDRVMS